MASVFDVVPRFFALEQFREISKKSKKSFVHASTLAHLNLEKNQDILKEISTLNKNRPDLVIGFSLETDNLIETAKEKLKNKSCDWIVANGHYNGKESVFDSDMNSVKLVENDNLEDWGYLTKNDVAEKLCIKISKFFNEAA